MEVEQPAKIITSPVAMAKLINTTKTLQKPEIFSKMALQIAHATAGPCSQYQPPQIGWLELERIGAIGMLEISSMTTSMTQSIPTSLLPTFSTKPGHQPGRSDCKWNLIVTSGSKGMCTISFSKSATCIHDYAKICKVCSDDGYVNVFFGGT